MTSGSQPKNERNGAGKTHAVEKAFKAAQQEAANAPKEPKELVPADILEQERLIKEATTKFESKFIKDIRTMLEDHNRAPLGIVCDVNSSTSQTFTNGKAKAS